MGKSWSTSLFGSYGIIGANNVEVTPEFAAKIGCAYGTILGKGSEVFTGRDVDKSSRMLKKSNDRLGLFLQVLMFKI